MLYINVKYDIFFLKKGGIPMSAQILAIVTVAIINNILGMIWYSKKCFGTMWAKSNKFDMGRMKSGAQHILGSLIVSLVTASVVFCFVQSLNLTMVSDGLKLGFLAWLGFVATNHFSGVIWAKKPLKVYFIDVGFLLISLLVMGALLTMWR